MDLIIGRRFRVTDSQDTVFNNKIGTAVAFDSRCGNIYLIFKTPKIRGRCLMLHIRNCVLVGKLKVA